jgi:hypothetical protein
MTTVSEVPLASPPRSVRPSDVVVALGLIAAELVLGWITYDIARALADHWSASRLVQWFYVMLPCLPLAVVVALHAIRPGRALAAALTALAAGAASIVQLELVRWIFLHHPDTDHHVVEIIGYSTVMVAATLAALAWGLSRRHGHAWPLGLLVAAGGAWLTVWTRWPGRLGWSHFASPLDSIAIRRAELVDTVAWMIPVVAACVVCWLIDAAELRRQTDPEIGSSA